MGSKGIAHCVRSPLSPVVIWQQKESNMGGIPLDQWSGSGATKELEKTVVLLSEASEKQTRHIIKLTYTMLFLTFVMACLVGVQIWLAIVKPEKMKQPESNPISISSQNSSQSQADPAHSPKELEKD